MIIQNEEQLRRPSGSVDERYCRQHDLFNKMEIALNGNPIEGWGIAAVQIGIHVRAGIIRMPKLHLNYFNPKIVDVDDLRTFKGEGCLSYPNKFLTTERYHECVVEFCDETGKKRTGVFYGLESIVIQHEIDHMNGILFMDRIVRASPKGEMKIGRNDPCLCGSGKKYKKCCGV